jgi:Zn-finger nucleic acid-binding protein
MLYSKVINMSWFCCAKKKEVKNDKIINCPRCKFPMIKKSRMGVTIDKCGKCEGIWLDSGEIEKILMKIQEEQKKFMEKQKKVQKKK